MNPATCESRQDDPVFGKPALAHRQTASKGANQPMLPAKKTFDAATYHRDSSGHGFPQPPVLKMSRKLFPVTLAIVSLALLVACDDGSKKNAQSNKPPPGVVVAPVTSKPVAASFEFVGQTEANQSVDLRARVTGFLRKQAFSEGETVKKDELLFVIDPSEFNAARDAAAAKVAGAEATIQEAELQLARYRELKERGTASVAKFDEAKATAGRARADLAAAKAELERAELDVGYTKISSPIAGRIGASVADVGNLVGPDSGILATVVALDPIRVTFPVSEREYLDYSERKKAGNAEDHTPTIRLANDQVYPHKGKFDFIDNRVDPATGTIKLRVAFPNPDGILLPGQFVNVFLVSSEPKDQLVVPQASIQENQTGPFVLIVDKQNKVEMRPVQTGQRTGAEIAIVEGLDPGETIIVDGIQKARPGITVKPVVQKTSKVQN